MKVLIVGYPYIKESYIRVFDYYPEKDNLFFLLPVKWKAKEGKIIYYPPEKKNILKTKALFYHSNYPLIGGLLKGWMPSFPFILFKLKLQKKIKLVYSVSEPILLTALYQGFFSKMFGLKHIIFSWENIPFSKKFKGINGLIHKIILKLNIYFSDGIVCGNKKCLEIFQSLTSKPLEVIPLSGIDENLFKPKNKDSRLLEKYNLKNKVVFIFAGSISYRKGIHLAVRAMEKVLNKIPNARLIIVGSGEYEKEIENLIAKLKLREYIIRVPWLSHNDLINFFSISDIFLYPSIAYKGWEEQFGYSIAEASLCGLPVISTKSGSIEEIVKDGETGILISEDNLEELEGAMVKLVKDKELRMKMSLRGREFIIKKFSNKIISEKFFNFFRIVLAQK